MKSLPNKILAFIIYTFVILFAGWNLRQRFEPQKSISENKSAENQKLKAHLTGTKKKRTDVKTGIIEEETNFSADIDSIFQKVNSSRQEIVTQPPPDNLKFPINSKSHIGVEVMPINHHWLGYMKDTKTGENIYQYSWSTRIF